MIIYQIIMYILLSITLVSMIFSSQYVTKPKIFVRYIIISLSSLFMSLVIMISNNLVEIL